MSLPLISRKIFRPFPCVQNPPSSRTVKNGSPTHLRIMPPHLTNHKTPQIRSKYKSDWYSGRFYRIPRVALGIAWNAHCRIIMCIPIDIFFTCMILFILWTALYFIARWWKFPVTERRSCVCPSASFIFAKHVFPYERAYIDPSKFQVWPMAWCI